MIEVEALTKRYANVTAVDRISFCIEKGEVVGFLGPNGAGKTTTMKILSCFMPATSGTAHINGHDVVREPLQVRRCIGYLPENVPIPPEMRVHEYLGFRARLKGLDRARRKARIPEVMGRCGVETVSRKLIGALSKGYRQRVGLADALLGDPPILILDEPTVGLDPNQIRLVRDLVRELGQERTILLSTHILPEVELVCSRVMIISRGRIRNTDTLESLRKGGGIGVTIEGASLPEITSTLAGIPGISAVHPRGAGNGGASLHLTLSSDPSEARRAVFRTVVGHGWTMTELSNESRRLEDIYLDIVSEDVVETTDPVPVTAGEA